MLLQAIRELTRSLPQLNILEVTDAKLGKLSIHKLCAHIIVGIPSYVTPLMRSGPSVDQLRLLVIDDANIMDSPPLNNLVIELKRCLPKSVQTVVIR